MDGNEKLQHVPWPGRLAARIAPLPVEIVASTDQACLPNAQPATLGKVTEVAGSARACLPDSLPGTAKSSKLLWRRRELNGDHSLIPSAISGDQRQQAKLTKRKFAA